MRAVTHNRSQRRYAILGTGALGGFYGARLCRAGLEVHFLLHQDYAHVKQHGLKVDSPEGDFVLPEVAAYADVRTMPKCNVVIVAFKTTQNHLLPDLLPAVLEDNGVVLVLQNGLGVEAEVAEIVGADRVLGGLCFICSNKIGPGYIQHIDYSAIALGEYAPNYDPVGVSDRLRQVADDFEQAGIPITLSGDLLKSRWQKLIWNIPFNGLSVVLNATTDEMMANPFTRSLAEQLMQEVVQGATACLQGASSLSDRCIPDHAISTMLEHTAQMKPYKTSMKLDYDHGRPLEVESIFGNPLRAAQQAGVDLPRVQTLYQQLKFLDSRNRTNA